MPPRHRRGGSRKVAPRAGALQRRKPAREAIPGLLSEIQPAGQPRPDICGGPAHPSSAGQNVPTVPGVSGAMRRFTPPHLLTLATLRGIPLSARGVISPPAGGVIFGPAASMRAPEELRFLPHADEESSGRGRLRQVAIVGG